MKHLLRFLVMRIDELIGKPHNIVRHPDMPHSVLNTLKRYEEVKCGKGMSKICEIFMVTTGCMLKFQACIKKVFWWEYKSSRAPMDEVSKIKMQREYDEKCATEENKTRVAAHLQNDIVHKVERLPVKKRVRAI